MAFISVFDVLGPNMIGPSSSHTAGAEIIAFLAQKMIAPPLKRADFTLYGSFAKTYHGHGTDRALLGGIMGFSADDTRIRDSFAIATDRGLGYSFTPNEVETDIHPNTVDIRMENAAGQVMTVRGESLAAARCASCGSTAWRWTLPASTMPSSWCRRTSPAWWRISQRSSATAA